MSKAHSVCNQESKAGFNSGFNSDGFTGKMASLSIMSSTDDHAGSPTSSS